MRTMSGYASASAEYTACRRDGVLDSKFKLHYVGAMHTGRHMAKRKQVYFDRDTMSFMGITDEIKQRIIQTYPWVKLDFELNKMSLWLMSTKGLRRAGNLQFISNWLAHVPVPASVAFDQVVIPDSTNLDHLEALWTKADGLLKMNSTIRGMQS